MRILLTGGSGLLGSIVAREAADAGDSVRLIARRTKGEGRFETVIGDLATGDGVDEAVRGVDAIIHAASDAMHPETVDVEGTRRMVTAARAAGVAHFIYVSIVGVDAIPFRYYACKHQAEQILETSGVNYSIVRATQFHDFMSRILGGLARVPLLLPVAAGVHFQPVDVEEVARRIVRQLRTGPSMRIEDYAGPEVLSMSDLARAWTSARGETRAILPLPLPGRFAAALRKARNTAPRAELGSRRWSEWLAHEFSAR